MEHLSEAKDAAPEAKAPEAMTAAEKAAWEKDMAAWKKAGLPLDVIASLETLLHTAATPYTSPDALLASVDSGAIAPLRGSWVVKLHERGGKLERRQDLPPEAFWTAAELRSIVGKLGEDYALLFVALSYRWLSKDHPDPEGFHLAIVAAVAKLYMKADHRFGSFSPLTAAFRGAGLGAPDFALFWDFASLYQKPRVGNDEALFFPGLKASNIWYGHEGTACWMQKELPEGFAFEPHLAQDYDVGLVLCRGGHLGRDQGGRTPPRPLSANGRGDGAGLRRGFL